MLELTCHGNSWHIALNVQVFTASAICICLTIQPFFAVIEDFRDLERMISTAFFAFQLSCFYSAFSLYGDTRKTEFPESSRSRRISNDVRNVSAKGFDLWALAFGAYGKERSCSGSLDTMNSFRDAN